MAEDRDVARMHPDDLAALARALQAGPVRAPVPPSPPDIFTGIDARTLSDMIRAVVAERVALFLPADAIRMMIREEMQEKLADIGLRIDEEHIQETGDANRSWQRWHKLIDRAAGTLAVSLLLGALYAVAATMGIHLPKLSTGSE